MYIEQIVFKQKEASIIASTKKSEGKGRPEVMNIKVRLRDNYNVNPVSRAKGSVKLFRGEGCLAYPRPYKWDLTCRER